MIHHNELRDITADLLSEVCDSFSMEPCLQPVTDVQLRKKQQTGKIEQDWTSWQHQYIIQLAHTHPTMHCIHLVFILSEGKLVIKQNFRLGMHLCTYT